MKRLAGFRWFLPLLMVALHLWVLSQNLQRQDGGAMDFALSQRGPLLTADLVLNLPALVVAAAPVIWFSGSPSVLNLFMAAVPAVLLLWCAVGKWFDHRFGLLATPRRTWPRRILAWLSLVVATAAFAGAVYAYTRFSGFLNMKDAAVATPVYALLAWLAWAELVSAMAAFRRK